VSAARVAVLGATGRLGRRVVAGVLAAPGLSLVAAFARRGVGVDAGLLAGGAPCGVLVTAPGDGPPADVLIDVSLPGGLQELGGWLGAAAVVSGVTGQDDAGVAWLDAHAARAPVLVAANFSLGVAVLADLVARATAALPDHDVEIVEAHHRHKRDAPSGTALLLAAAATGGGEPTSFGRSGHSEGRAPGVAIHAVRGGDIVGEHQVWLCGDGERLLLGHTATSRDTFAAGAVRAARWVVGRPPGRYQLTQVLGLSTQG
jgi:4-hydroxy-tetrahydrodipicolinate reductase